MLPGLVPVETERSLLEGGAGVGTQGLIVPFALDRVEGEGFGGTEGVGGGEDFGGGLGPVGGVEVRVT